MRLLALHSCIPHVLGLLALAGNAFSQTNPACSFLGPVFPSVEKGLNDSVAIRHAVAQLKDKIDKVVKQGTDTTFHIQAFSGTDKLFSYGYAPPSAADSLTSGTLNENTVFRIGSVSKLITVYTLLAEVGMARLNDPITKWVPELAKSAKHLPDRVQSPHWDEVTVGQLASHMSGIERNCKLLSSVLFHSYPLTLGQVGLADYSSLIVNPAEFGLPPLKSQDKPTCDAVIGRKACTRKRQ
jgi:CubicO group peptidase (beta-lactamase class C family)